MSGRIGDARTRTVALRALLTAAPCLLVWVVAKAQTSVPFDVLKERREMALHVLSQGPDEQIAEIRRACAAGTWVNTVALQRKRGWMNTPDASDTCPNALARVGRDAGLHGPYARLVAELAGDEAMVSTLPASIGAAVTKGGGDVVAVGNQRGAKITPALALDAGFTVAYQNGLKHAAGMPDLATLKPIAERCFAQAESNLALCYSTGFVYGARAFSQLPLMP